MMWPVYVLRPLKTCKSLQGLIFSLFKEQTDFTQISLKLSSHSIYRLKMKKKKKKKFKWELKINECIGGRKKKVLWISENEKVELDVRWNKLSRFEMVCQTHHKDYFHF